MKWYYITGIVIVSMIAGFFVRYATEDKWMVKAPANTSGSEGETSELV
jgi:hypothetical protein